MMMMDGWGSKTSWHPVTGKSIEQFPSLSYQLTFPCSDVHRLQMSVSIRNSSVGIVAHSFGIL